MRKWVMTVWVIVGVVLALWCGISASAQYGSESRSGRSVSTDDGNFEESVDLRRFRKGEPNWDTQQLIASGLTALHRENQEILRQLKELKKDVQNLSENNQ